MTPPGSAKNLEKGVGKGRGLRVIWAEQGFTPEEVQEKWQARIDLIKAVKARKRLKAMEKYGEELGLGSAAQVARDIEAKTQELRREFKASPLKGVRHQSTVLRDQQKRQQREAKEREKAFNPPVRGLEGVPGLELGPDGTIGLEELRRQRPDIFKLRPQPVEGRPTSTRFTKIHEQMLAAGREDPYYDNIKRPS